MPVPARQRSLCLSLMVTIALVVAAALPAMAAEERTTLASTIGDWIKEQTKGSENDQGKKTKRGYFSRTTRDAADGNKLVTVHLETAGERTKTTERYELTLKQTGETWEFVKAELKDTFAGMHREWGTRCAPFKKMKFDREGLTLSGGAGVVCQSLYQDSVNGFAVHASGMQYRYEPPDYADALHLQPDFHSLFDMVKGDHKRELTFDPAAFLFTCDPATCEELLAECFEGLETGRATEYKGFKDTDNVDDWLRPLYRRTAQERLQTPFVHFSEPYRPGNRTYLIYIPRELNPFTYPGWEPGLIDVSGSLPGPGVQFSYNNWGGYELKFSVYPRRIDDPEQLFGTIYGYYTKETLQNSTPYDLEVRDDESARWHHVFKVKGDVDLGTEDPEMLAADIEFGIELKQPLRVLPFFIQSIPLREFTGKNKSRTLYVNSVQMDGEDLTWVRTSQLGGLIILPEEMPAGSRVNLRMEFKTRAMVKYTFSFTMVSRFGWMPFVRFGDFIDEFELTVRAPEGYKVLGIGHLVEEKTEKGVTTTSWKSDSPVVFPSMTLGRYRYNDAGKKFDPATKADGTPIPIVVHVDEASAADWDITPAKLRPIAQQATNSINLYREVSGLDYPYGKLDFVNDPRGFLYGQAPSSLIYLGQGVFRGEGFLAPFFSNPAGIAKFLKSVVAHEVGHQWWGSRVSNANERNYWFVESLAEYFSALYLEAVFGRKEYLEQVEEWRRNILNTELKSSVQNASAIWSGEFGGYQAAVYNKGPFAFHMLREIFGDEKFFAFLKAFSQELDEKREIVTLDIQGAAESGLGGVDENGKPYKMDLGWFFDQWIRGTGAPQYRFTYDTRRTEDRSWLVEGTIEQRIVVGSKQDFKVLEGKYYRGVVDITVKTSKNEYTQRMIIEGRETPFLLKVPEKPLDVFLNKENDILSHDVLTNQGW